MIINILHSHRLFIKTKKLTLIEECSLNYKLSFWCLQVVCSSLFFQDHLGYHFAFNGRISSSTPIYTVCSCFCCFPSLLGLYTFEE